MTLLLAILQAGTVVTLQQAMLRAVLARAEPALAHDRLDLLLALVCWVILFKVAFGQFGGHAAAEGESEVQRGGGG